MVKPHCWWCCYPFDWESLHFPYAFTANTFHTTGHFCSWGCMKAYAIDRNKHEQCEYITLMKKRIEGKITPTQRAPSRYCLEMFGGNTTIEEFRQSSLVNINVKIPGEFYQEQIVIKQEKPIEVGDLKLKREKPLERSKGKLETSLGIIRKCSAVSEEKKSQSKTKA